MEKPHLASKCRSRRTKLHDEFDAVSKTLEVTTDGRARKEMEQRLAAIQTSLNAVVWLWRGGCRCQNGQPGRNLESSGPHMEADTKDNPPSASGGDTISHEEEELLLGGTPQPENHSPRSKTTLVSGGMAELRLASPTHPGPEEGETPQ